MPWSTRVPLDTLYDYEISLMQPRTGRRGRRLRTSCGPGARPTIYADLAK